MDGPPLRTFDAACDGFLRRTRHTGTGSVHTHRAYRTDLEAFRRFLVEQSLDYRAVGRADAERYVDQISSRGAARTVRRRISCVRSFYAHARRLEDVATNPFDAVDLPSIDRMSETHKVWSGDDVDRALTLLRAEVREAAAAVAAAPTDARPRARRRLFHAVRRRAVFVVLVTSGLRRAELAGLQADSLLSRPDGFSLSIRGKGSKVREVPLSTHAHPALFDWLSVRRRTPTPSDALFVSETGGPLTPKGVYRTCRWIARRVHARFDLHPHLCRRTFATTQLEATGNLRGVQEVLGHASVATTQIYTHVDRASLRRVVESAGLARSERSAGPLVSA